MKTINCLKILEEFHSSLNFIQGHKDMEVQGPGDPKSTDGNLLLFIHSEKFLNDLPQDRQVLIVSENLVDLAKSKNPKLLISTKNINLAQSVICKKFFPIVVKQIGENLIHASVCLGDNSKIGEGTSIGPNVVIGHNVSIGRNCKIKPNTVIEDGTSIGDSTHIHALVYIGPNTKIGNFCEVHPNTSIGSEGFGFANDNTGAFHRIPHYGIVEIHDYVEIGSNVSIDRGKVENTVLHEGTKIDNHCHIAHNVKIGKHSGITAGFIVAGSTTIGDHFTCGGRTSVTGHIKITDKVQLGAVSTALKNIENPGNYAGFPLQPHGDAIRTQASLPALPKLKRQVAKILKKLGL
ncbi:MAG: UDP-3-O-(3-hydroxymyristoyl)glucosamine N-acyltransferase [Bdellovibrionaceae bacterium]|nr:UDP-3-O-(3-hydroxymyristoyl)glucosamine N-acyltransferase [Pseudobdellovibrionaceae bacterium]